MRSSESSITSPHCMDESTPASVDTLGAPGMTNWTPHNAPMSSPTTPSEQPPSLPTQSHYSFVVEEIRGPSGVVTSRFICECLAFDLR